METTLIIVNVILFLIVIWSRWSIKDLRRKESPFRVTEDGWINFIGENTIEIVDGTDGCDDNEKITYTFKN